MSEEKQIPQEETAQPTDTAPQPEKAEKETKAGKDAKAAKRQAEVEAIKAKLEEFEQQAKDTKETLLRTAAEYDNFRKRSAKERDAAFQNGVSHAVEHLLPVLDTLTLAASADTQDESYKKGVLLTLEQCKKAFTALGITEIEALGKPFDPNLHAAVMQQPATDDAPAGTVLQVLQAGYQLGDKVIRHATVAVAE